MIKFYRKEKITKNKIINIIIIQAQKQQITKQTIIKKTMKYNIRISKNRIKRK